MSKNNRATIKILIEMELDVEYVTHPPEPDVGFSHVTHEPIAYYVKGKSVTKEFWQTFHEMVKEDAFDDAVAEELYDRED